MCDVALYFRHSGQVFVHYAATPSKAFFFSIPDSVPLLLDGISFRALHISLELQFYKYLQMRVSSTLDREVSWDCGLRTDP